VTFPAITTLALVAVPFVMYFTTWYTAAFHSDAVREITYLALMAPGFVFFWTLLRVDPVPKVYSYGVSLWITAFEVVGDAFLGLAVIADQNLIGAAYYHALARPWGPSLQTDQILGGGTLWIFGDLVGLPFLVAQLIQWMREDEAEAAVIDAELDARDAEQANVRSSGSLSPDAHSAAAPSAAAPSAAAPSAAAPSATAPSAAAPSATARPATAQPEAPADPERPWWENDPRFSDRFRQV
jgi:hypothetical protein